MKGLHWRLKWHSHWLHRYCLNLCVFFTQLQGLGPAHWEAAGKGSEGEQKVKWCWEEKNGERVTTFLGGLWVEGGKCWDSVWGRGEKEGFQRFLLLAVSWHRILQVLKSCKASRLGPWHIASCKGGHPTCQTSDLSGLPFRLPRLFWALPWFILGIFSGCQG